MTEPIGHAGDMATWFTADLHLGHGNIIRYAERPFSGVEEMRAVMVDRWNSVVAPGDTVWVLGDFALGKLRETLPVAGELHGHKILLAGNHDRCWAGHRHGSTGWAEKYLDAGFAEVRQGAVDAVVAGQRVVLCHFPYEGDSHDQDRHVEHRPGDQGRWLLHGHVHQAWGQRGRMINVGVDVAGFAPVPEHRIAELVAAGPADRVALDG
jgi:calcineurin-like phosphoesterase family protein